MGDLCSLNNIEQYEKSIKKYEKVHIHVPYYLSCKHAQGSHPFVNESLLTPQQIEFVL